LHPDGSLLFTGDLGGSGMIWDLRTGKSIIPILGHVKQLISSAFSENGYHLATGSDDNTVKLWDIRRRNCFYTIPAHNKLISDLKF
jgi:U4/U6 small nuclear ribonucleoprotein PRP4